MNRPQCRSPQRRRRWLRRRCPCRQRCLLRRWMRRRSRCRRAHCRRSLFRPCSSRRGRPSRSDLRSCCLPLLPQCRRCHCRLAAHLPRRASHCSRGRRSSEGMKSKVAPAEIRAKRKVRRFIVIFSGSCAGSGSRLWANWNRQAAKNSRNSANSAARAVHDLSLQARLRALSRVKRPAFSGVFCGC